jgi:hypothetical protein
VIQLCGAGRLDWRNGSIIRSYGRVLPPLLLSWHETARRRLCPVPAVGSVDPAQGLLLGERRRVGRFWTMGFEPGLFVRPPLRLARIEL